jgi:hypothetical protein
MFQVPVDEVAAKGKQDGTIKKSPSKFFLSGSFSKS